MASAALHTWKLFLFILHSSLQMLGCSVLWDKSDWQSLYWVAFSFTTLTLGPLGSQIVQNYVTHGKMTYICLISLLCEQLIKECERRKKITLKFLGDCCYSHQITWIAFLSGSFFLHYSYIVPVSPQFTRGEYKQSAHFFILWYSLSLSLLNLFLENHFILTWIERIHI